MRLLRGHQELLQLLPKSALPQMPGPDQGRVAGKTPGGAFAMRLLPYGIHRSPRP